MPLLRNESHNNEAFDETSERNVNSHQYLSIPSRDNIRTPPMGAYYHSARERSKSMSSVDNKFLNVSAQSNDYRRDDEISK